MAKSAYIGDTTGIAKKIKKMYVGDANGVARKVKKAYIGDANGIARLFYSGEKAVRWICMQTNYAGKMWTSTGENFEAITPSTNLTIQYPYVQIIYFKGKYFAIAGDNNNNNNRIYSSPNLVTWTLVKTVTTDSSYAYAGRNGSFCITEDGSKLLVNYSQQMNAGRLWTSDGVTWSQGTNIGSSSSMVTQIVADNKYVLSGQKPTTSTNAPQVYKTTLASFMSNTSSIATSIYSASNSSFNISYMAIGNGCVYFLEYPFYSSSTSSLVKLHEYNLSTNAHREIQVSRSVTDSNPRICSLYIEGDYLYAVADYVMKFNINTMTYISAGGGGEAYPSNRKGVVIKNDKIWVIGQQTSFFARTYYIDKTTLVSTLVTNNTPPQYDSYTAYACAFPIE